jgi:CheY-like chemotaxis protein
MTKSVLIIDDDEDIREVAKMALEATTSWQVRTMPDGPAGIQEAMTDPPDVILLDYMMPGMDGITALKQLKSEGKTTAVPVIVFTAKSESGLATRLKEAGATGHVAKPFDPMALAGTIKGLLDWNADE